MLEEMKHPQTLSPLFCFEESVFFKRNNIQCLKKRRISPLQAALTNNSRCIGVPRLAHSAAEKQPTVPGFVALDPTNPPAGKVPPHPHPPRGAVPAHLLYQGCSSKVSV